MRKIVAIFFLMLFTVSSTEAGQLLKLPLLYKHLNEHLQQGRSHSVYDFLAEHYLGYHGNDEDSDEDRELPFKSISPNIIGNIFIKTANVEIEITLPIVINFFPSYEGDPALSNYHAEIFHPPGKI